jgi:hypothetical protein
VKIALEDTPCYYSARFRRSCLIRQPISDLFWDCEPRAMEYDTGMWMDARKSGIYKKLPSRHDQSTKIPTTLSSIYKESKIFYQFSFLDQFFKNILLHLS